MDIVLSPELISLLGIFLGLLARSMLPFLRKIYKEGKDITWDNKYTALLLISAIITLLTFPGFRAVTNMSLADPYGLFITAFGFGFLVDSAAIEGFEWLRPGKTQTTQPSQPSP